MNESEPSLALADTEIAVQARRPDRDRLAERIRVITPGRTSFSRLLQDLWHARELLYFLIWRDVKVRYKQTLLGVLWAIIQPVMTMVVLSIFFGRLAGIGKLTGHVPYPIFVYSGLLPWTFFASTLQSCSNSVVGNSSLVTKIRFPRITLPIAAVAGGLVDLGISFLVLIVLMICYHVPITARILWAPILVMGVAAITLGFGTIFAALTVTYRDFRYVVPFMTQIWMFMTPVIYPLRVVPDKWRWLLTLNPLTGWIGGCRSVFLGDATDHGQLGVAALITVLMLLIGAYYFRATERRFADVI